MALMSSKAFILVVKPQKIDYAAECSTCGFVGRGQEAYNGPSDDSFILDGEWT